MAPTEARIAPEAATVTKVLITMQVSGGSTYDPDWIGTVG
jgi:hypothetical protein